MASLDRKILHGLKVAVSGALGISALALLVWQPPPSQAIPQDRVVIDYWEKWTGAEEAAMQQVVDDFNATDGREKNIYVRYLSTSDIEQKTLVATAAGLPPDVAGLYNQDIPQFGSMNSLEPLDQLAAENNVTADQYKKVYWDECQFDGHLYGLVSSVYDIALFYNKSIFAKNAEEIRKRGLDPDGAPRTIAQLDQYAEAIDRIDPAGRILFAGYIPAEPGWYLAYTCLWFGGRWWDDVHHKFTFTDPNVVRAYEWVNSYSKRLGPLQVAAYQSGFGQFDSPTNSFLAPTVAMVQQGTFFAGYIHRQAPSMAGQWGAVAFPSEDPALKNVTYCNCDVLCIPRGSRHKKEAFEFMAFVNRQTEMEKLARLHGKISPLSKVSAAFFENNSNPYVRVFDDLAASPNAHPTEPIPILPEVNDEMNNFNQLLALQKVTPMQGLQQMQDRLQKRYDEFVEDQRKRRQ